MNWKRPGPVIPDISPSPISNRTSFLLTGLPISKAPAFFHGLELRTFYGARYRKLNQDLLALCRKAKPDIVWVDKGFWIWPSTLRVLKGQGVYLAQHNTDALRHRTLRTRWLYYLLTSGLQYYDHYFTTNRFDYDELLGKPGPQVHFTYLGYNPRRFEDPPLTPEEQREWGSDLLFAGHYEPRTEAGIVALLKAGLKVKVTGKDWSKAVNKDLLAGCFPRTAISPATTTSVSSKPPKSASASSPSSTTTSPPPAASNCPPAAPSSSPCGLTSISNFTRKAKKPSSSPITTNSFAKPPITSVTTPNAAPSPLTAVPAALLPTIPTNATCEMTGLRCSMFIIATVNRLMPK